VAAVTVADQRPVEGGPDAAVDRILGAVPDVHRGQVLGAGHVQPAQLARQPQHTAGSRRNVSSGRPPCAAWCPARRPACPGGGPSGSVRAASAPAWRIAHPTTEACRSSTNPCPAGVPTPDYGWPMRRTHWWVPDRRHELVVDALDMANGRGGLQPGCVPRRVSGPCSKRRSAPAHGPTAPPPAPRSSPSSRPSTTAAACASTRPSATSPRPRPGNGINTPSRHDLRVSKITGKRHGCLHHCLTHRNPYDEQTAFPNSA
jgi:hypothetical protein